MPAQPARHQRWTQAATLGAPNPSREPSAVALVVHYGPRMALPRLLLQVVDPAQVYFDRHRLAHQRGERPAHWQAAILGPDIEDGGRAATDAERAELAQEAARDREDYEAALADAKRRWAPQLQRAADQLLGAGATQIRLGDER
jgi:hypothetical protein